MQEDQTSVRHVGGANDEIVRMQHHYEMLVAENMGLKVELERERAALAAASSSNAPSTTPQENTGDMNVSDFLKMNGLENLSQRFDDEELYKVSELYHLSDDDLSSVLKLKLGPRNKLRVALKALEEEAPPGFRK